MKGFLLLIIVVFFTVLSTGAKAFDGPDGSQGKDDRAIIVAIADKCMKADSGKLECIEKDLVELGSLVGVIFIEGEKITVDEIEVTDKIAQKDALFTQVAVRLLIFGAEDYRNAIFIEATDRAKRMISEGNIKGSEEIKRIIMLSYMRFCNSLIVLQADASLYNRLIACFKGMEMDYNQIAEQFRTAVIEFQNEYNAAYERFRETHPSKKKPK